MRATMVTLLCSRAQGRNSMPLLMRRKRYQ
jgi:hypothetical protein